MSPAQADITRSAWNASLQEFGAWLRERRERQLGLSQAELAAQAGLDQSTISRIETGHKPRDKATALSLARVYRLSRTETHQWLELLYGSTTLFGTAEAVEESWGQQIERAYALLDLFPHSATDAFGSSYFSPTSETIARLNQTPQSEISAIVDWVLADRRRLPRAHLLVEYATVFIHYLNETGQYRRRLALGLAAADAAQQLERYTVEGWLRSDAIPWTLMEQRRDPLAARKQLQQGLALAHKLHNQDMKAVVYAFVSRTFLLEHRLSEAQENLNDALSVRCSPQVRMRVLWVAGQLALAYNKTVDAVNYYRQAEKLDLSLAQGYYTAVTPAFSLSDIYLRLQKPDAAGQALEAVLRSAQPPLAATRLARAKLGLAKASRMQKHFALAHRYAAEANEALQTADLDLSFSVEVREFLMGLPD